jgi:hypothetical protein
MDEWRQRYFNHLTCVCDAWGCEYKDSGSHKNFCCKENEMGALPSKELMLDCALRYNQETADELRRLRVRRDKMDKDEKDRDVKEDGYEEGPSFKDWVEETFDVRTIPNPFDEESLMVIIVSGGRAIIGGIKELDDTLQPVYHPLSFAELPTKSNERGEILEIGIKLTKLFMTMEKLDFMLFRPDSFHFLRSNKATELAIVGDYEKGLKKVMGDDSNIMITDQMPAPGAVPRLEPVR